MRQRRWQQEQELHQKQQQQQHHHHHLYQQGQGQPPCQNHLLQHERYHRSILVLLQKQGHQQHYSWLRHHRQHRLCWHACYKLQHQLQHRHHKGSYRHQSPQHLPLQNL